VTVARYLGDTQAAGAFDLARAVQTLAAQGGPGPVRQAFDLMRLLVTRTGVRPEEYYTYALWRQDRGRAFLKGFLPNWHKKAFNASLRMPDRGPPDAVLNDKLATEAILRSRGLATVRTRASFVPPGAALPEGTDGVVRLTSAGEIAAWLGEAANLPVFGKPRSDSFARGAAVFAEASGPESLRFQDGRTVPRSGLAAEIARDWAEGYLFQPVYRVAPDLRRHTGAAMASVRIVTLLTDGGAEPWYAVIRLPAQGAMHDGDAEGRRLWGLIDIATGEILRLRDLRNPEAPDQTHAADPDQPFLGTRLPDWAQAVALCQSGHDSFPGHGVIGWDVFLTGDGPLLNEANASPGHLYQVAAQRPLLNPDLRPAYDRALAFARRHGAAAPGF
jgi:hypothetical protein